LIRRAVRDEQGRKVGHEVVGPMPEPPLCPLFCVREQVVSHFDYDGQFLREGRLVERATFHDHGIPEAYRAARTPLPRADLVTPLRRPADATRRLRAEAQAWYEGK